MIDVTHNVNASDSNGRLPIYAFFSTKYAPGHPPGGTLSLRVFLASGHLSGSAGIRSEMAAAGVSSVRNWFAQR